MSRWFYSKARLESTQHIILLICPRAEVMSEICNLLSLEHAPAELHIWLSGERIFRNEIA